MSDPCIQKDFNLEIVLSGFVGCGPQPDGELVLNEYLNAFKELCRFFKLMGKIFGFVAKDLETKITNLEGYILSSDGHNYKTIQTMILYEVENNLVSVKAGHLASGSRTLLRLHQALEFILTFMKRVSESKDEDKLSNIASDVYKQTLAKHHSWLVQRMASIVMYTLPSRKQMLESLCIQDYNQVLCLLKDVCEAGWPIYETTQQLFEENELLFLHKNHA